MTDFSDTIDAAISEFQAYLNTGMPCKVVAWDGGQLVTVAPMVRFVDVDDTVVTLPNLPDVLVQYPGGGGFVLTFPIQAGDDCFVTFSQSCIDSWWDTGDLGTVLSKRKHDLSDGFAHFGFNAKSRTIPNVDSDAIALRSKNGQAFVKVKADGTIVIDGTKLIVKCPTELEETQLVKGDATFENNVEVQGGFINTAVKAGAGAATFAKDLIIKGISFLNHTHPDTTSGGNTGKPNG